MSGYIGRFEAVAGAEHTMRRLDEARRQMEYTFRNDDQREIPQVKAVFDLIDQASNAANWLKVIFGGSGTHTVADFMPDESGTSVNDRQLEERRKNRGAW